MTRDFSEKYRIVYYDTDVTGNISIGKLIDIMMLASEDHGDSIGLTTEKINEMNLGWVITQHVLDVIRFPVKNEVVTVKTRATGYNKYFCYRDFWIEDEDKNLLVKMKSVFVLMNHVRRRIVPLDSNLIADFDTRYTKKVQRFEQIKLPNKLNIKRNYHVRFMDIDSNHHVNNVHYFEWMLDTLDADFLLNHTLKKMNIIFKQEIRYGNDVLSLANIEKNTTYHKIKTEDKDSCIAKIMWEDK